MPGQRSRTTDKKKASRKKKATPPRRSSRRTDALAQMEPRERAEHFRECSVGDLLKLFEHSYEGDLVNLLLDLKRSDVRTLFERLVAQRKRALAPAITLFHYKAYLLDPLPLNITGTDGEEIPNYYAILGLPREVPYEDLREAYRLLSRAFESANFAPARRKSGEESFKEITTAYEALKTAKRRAEADVLLPNISYLYPRRDQSWFEAVKRFLD